MARLVSRVIFGFFGIPVRAYGLERFPQSSSGVIAASNFQSRIDPLALLLALPQPLFFLAEPETLKFPNQSWVSKKMENIHLLNGRLSAEGFKKFRNRIQKGISGVIFPEGQPGSGFELQTFRRGAVFLASRLQCPLVPVAIHGSRSVFPPTAIIPRVHLIRILVGIPHPPEAFPRDASGKQLQELAASLQFSVNELFKILERTPIGQNPALETPAPLPEDSTRNIFSHQTS